MTYDLASSTRSFCHARTLQISRPAKAKAHEFELLMQRSLRDAASEIPTTVS
ncbi:hypothetical protein CFIMG_000852RA [Ceratocystis fimbriata CBS 114723]|uniref:Uncharacterized protein n=1 Tax=Ceratocystis fimbriata CBS 114723 TaxID=1035309 RepID=A0A2C5XGS1_9PEZI|nr:hypothetical protein CFIMG_000852RA [Ceratocystis fimbriata CBS 114723]